jgi:peptide/nickel transport system permease protein
LVVALSLLVLLDKINLSKSIKSFFFKKIIQEYYKNKLLRLGIILIFVLVGIGFLAPFLAPYNPHDMSSVIVTKYLPPFSRAKYIQYEELEFENSNFYYETGSKNYSRQLSECRLELNPNIQKVYYDSLKTDGGSLLLFQGGRIKTLPSYSINLKNAGLNEDRFILGTDGYGRDVLSRIIYGTRVSLGAALIATLFSLIIGIILGLISGYFQKLFDTLLMRITDIFLSFPVIFLLLLIVGVFGNSFFYISLFIGLTTWMDVSRLTRAQVLAVRNETYILSAKAAGYSSFRILYRHILPNVITPIIINGAFRIGNIILMESALSFIGLGVNEPVPSWGSIINSGKDTLLNAWWISLFPGITITASVILFNYLGDVFRRIIKIK